MSLYHHPEIYAALFRPDPEIWQVVQTWVRHYGGHSPERVLDPACGPGNWLLPFAAAGLRVAGSDIERRMIAYARCLLRPFSAELTVADMRQLSFQSGPFDLAINLDASVGHLPDSAAVVDHLRAIQQNLSPGGIYLLGVVLLDGHVVDSTVRLLYASDLVAIPSGGSASVCYESFKRDPVGQRESIRLTLTTERVRGCAGELQEQYDLLTFDEPSLRRILSQVVGLELLAVHYMALDGFPEQGFQPGCHGVTLILRRL